MISVCILGKRFLFYNVLQKKLAHMSYFYSARLRFILISSDPDRHRDGTYKTEVRFVLLRAVHDADAFERALAIGREEDSNPSESVREDGTKILCRWAFVEIEELSYLGLELDGVEISSLYEEYRPSQPIDFDTIFHPKNSKPEINNTAISPVNPKAEQDESQQHTTSGRLKKVDS